MENNDLVSWVRRIVASVFFIGYLPASGTFASAAVVIALWYYRARLDVLHLSTNTVGYLLLCMAAIAVSLFFSNKSRDLFGKEDSGKIVIDEVAGQLITFLFVPLSIRTLIAGFLLFRLFDIIKPYPVHHMEQLEGGVGVTMDDVAAGVMANISLIVILFAYHHVRAALI